MGTHLPVARGQTERISHYKKCETKKISYCKLHTFKAKASTEQSLLEDDDSALGGGSHFAIFFNIYLGYDVIKQEQAFWILLPYSIPCPCILRVEEHIKEKSRWNSTTQKLCKTFFLNNNVVNIFQLTLVLSKFCMTLMLATWQSCAQDSARRERATTYRSILPPRKEEEKEGTDHRQLETKRRHNGEQQQKYRHAHCTASPQDEQNVMKLQKVLPQGYNSV